MAREDYLFSKVDWFSVEEHQKRELAKDVSATDPDRLLSTPIDDLSDYFASKYKIDVPVLRDGDIVVDQKEVQIDISGDPMRFVRDRDRPFYMPGTEIEVQVPFEGESQVFDIQPTMFSINPPQAEARNGVLILKIHGMDLQTDKVKEYINRQLAEIKTHLDRLLGSAENLNNQLDGLARQAIEQRRQKLLADRNLVASLGFAIKERPGSAKTYTAPEVRRKVTPSLPPAGTAPFRPEPALSQPDFEHIISVLENMAHVIERSPSAFASMDEEALRFHFLVPLNGHFEGQATGETFNYQGKTDILIRSDGKNIFIAECKYWGGPKKLIDTIDQLLGYSSWRDTKTAIILFNRNKDFTRVLQQIPDAVKSHPNFKKDLGQKSETSFRYTFSQKNDLSRELLLAILAFEVPA